MKSIYDTNSHSLYLLQYHLVLVIKHGKSIIHNDMADRLIEIFKNISSKEQYRLSIIGFDYQESYLHIFFKAEPKSEISRFVGAYKSASSRLIKKEFPHIVENLYKKSFWSNSFFLCTSDSGFNKEALDLYVSNQSVEKSGRGNPKFKSNHWKKRISNKDAKSK